MNRVRIKPLAGGQRVTCRRMPALAPTLTNGDTVVCFLTAGDTFFNTFDPPRRPLCQTLRLSDGLYGVGGVEGLSRVDLVDRKLGDGAVDAPVAINYLGDCKVTRRRQNGDGLVLCESLVDEQA